MQEVSAATPAGSSDEGSADGEEMDEHIVEDLEDPCIAPTQEIIFN